MKMFKKKIEDDLKKRKKIPKSPHELERF